MGLLFVQHFSSGNFKPFLLNWPLLHDFLNSIFLLKFPWNLKKITITWFSFRRWERHPGLRHLPQGRRHRRRRQHRQPHLEHWGRRQRPGEAEVDQRGGQVADAAGGNTRGIPGEFNITWQREKIFCTKINRFMLRFSLDYCHSFFHE